MKLRYLFTAQAVCSLFFGSSLLLVPALLTSLYGATLSPGGIYNCRLLGAAILGICVVAWSARNAPDSEARRAIVLGLFVAQSIGFIASLVGQLSGMVNAVGWSTVVLYLLLALGYGYFQFMKPSAS